MTEKFIPESEVRARLTLLLQKVADELRSHEVVHGDQYGTWQWISEEHQRQLAELREPMECGHPRACWDADRCSHGLFIEDCDICDGPPTKNSPPMGFCTACEKAIVAQKDAEIAAAFKAMAEHIPIHTGTYPFLACRCGKYFDPDIDTGTEAEWWQCHILTLTPAHARVAQAARDDTAIASAIVLHRELLYVLSSEKACSFSFCQEIACRCCHAHAKEWAEIHHTDECDVKRALWLLKTRNTAAEYLAARDAEIERKARLDGEQLADMVLVLPRDITDKYDLLYEKALEIHAKRIAACQKPAAGRPVSEGR